MNKLNLKNMRLVSAVILMSLLLPVLAQEAAKSSGPLTMETVLFHTDRSIYLPGEEVLLAATILEADTYKPSELSQVVRAELINSDGNSILQEKFEVSSGFVTQKIRLPEGTPTGWYQIRLYTNWMRNLPVRYFSSSRVRIVNPSELDNIVISDKPDTVKVSLLSSGRNNLVSGTENRYAVRAVDMNGNPVALSGVMLSSRNDTITDFKTGKTGWGTVEFAPQTDISYRFASVTDQQLVVISETPKVTTPGVLMTVKQIQGTLNVKVVQPETWKESDVKVLVHSLYNWYWYYSVTTIDGGATFSIPTRNLPPSGIVQISLLDRQNTLIAARLVTLGEVVTEGGGIYIDQHKTEADGDISVRFSVDREGSDGNYNLIVRRKEPAEINSLYIPGLPGWPACNSIPLESAERDGWLLANTYDTTIASSFFQAGREEPLPRTLNVTDPIYMKEQMISFLPETRGLKISGMVTKKSDGEPLAGEILTITTLSDNFLYTAMTYESGRFHFSLPGRQGREEVVLSYARHPSDDWRLTLFPDFDDRPAEPVPARLSLTRSELEYVRGLSIDMQLKALYDKSDNSPDQAPLKGRNNLLLGYPDFEVFVDDYIRLPNMREVIFEVVPFVVTRKSGDSWSMRVTGVQAFPEQFHSLILLDGIPMIQYGDFLNLPPERIRKIEVINSLYIHGNAIFAGAVNFVSSNGDLAGLSLPQGSQIISIQTPAPDRSFEKKPAATRQPNIPGLDGTLQIAPFITSGTGTLNFRSNSNLGEYVVVISGFTNNGKWSNSISSFEIRGDHPAR
jgi:hypothetical protein